jgi:type VI secretion system protein ImpK
MSDANPFGGSGDGERTVIRPNPGGRRPETAAPPAPAGGSGQPAAIPMEGVNPVVAAAAAILGLAMRIRGRANHPDVDALRLRVIEEIKAFENRMRNIETDPQIVRAGHYALCATIDDLVLSTPWGSHSNWGMQSIVSTFHKEVSGGERFFTILDQIQKVPGRFLNVLELMYTCISLGFEGKYRVLPRGASMLAGVRESLYQTIRLQRGEYERELSPHWTGVEAAHRPLHAKIPLWVIAAVVLGLLAVIFIVFTYLLNQASDERFAALHGLPPTGQVVLARAVPAPPPPPVVVPTAQLPRLRKFLEPEIRDGLVTVFEDNQSITVRLRNQGMFASGSATLEPRYNDILTRIGQALQLEKGPVIVRGHTDNQPIHTVAMPSNWNLSVARAKAAAAVIEKQLTDKSRITAEGHADEQPIASNATPEGREQNRRTEVVLMKVPEGS